MQEQMTQRMPLRFSTLPEGEIRAIFDEWPGAVVQFYPKGEGVVLDYIRVRRGNRFNGATLFADALRALAGPGLCESTERACALFRDCQDSRWQLGCQRRPLLLGAGGAHSTICRPPSPPPIASVLPCVLSVPCG